METKNSIAPVTLKKKKAPTKKKPVAMAKAAPMPVVPAHSVCKTCSLLPVGSVELTSLLLVLVFSLVSVLFTAVFALNSQQHKISELQELVSNS